MEIQKRMFPNLSNFAVQIGSFVARLQTLVKRARTHTRDPACKDGYASRGNPRDGYSCSLFVAPI